MSYGTKWTSAEKMNVGNGKVIKTMMDTGEHGLKTEAITLTELFLILQIQTKFLWKRLSQQIDQVLFFIIATIRLAAIQNIYIWVISKTIQETKLNVVEAWTLAGTKAQGAN
jgi:hypothetical protein